MGDMFGLSMRLTGPASHNAFRGSDPGQKRWIDNRVKPRLASATENHCLGNLVPLLTNADDAEIALPFGAEFTGIGFVHIVSGGLSVLEEDSPGPPVRLRYCDDPGTFALALHAKQARAGRAAL